MTRRASLLAFGCCLLILGLVQLPVGEGRTAGHEDHFLVGCGGGECHGPATSTLVFKLEGVPGEYKAEQVYTLNLSISGGPVVANASSLGQGGFDLYVTQGQFQLIGPDAGSLRLGRSDRELSNTANVSERRSWTFRWMAPEAGSGKVEFQLAVLAGDAQGDEGGDQWETLRLISEGSNFSWRKWIQKGLGIALVAAVLLYARSKMKEADRLQREKQAREAKEKEGVGEGDYAKEDPTETLMDPLAPMPFDGNRVAGRREKDTGHDTVPDPETRADLEDEPDGDPDMKTGPESETNGEPETEPVTSRSPDEKDTLVPDEGTAPEQEP